MNKILDDLQVVCIVEKFDQVMHLRKKPNPVANNIQKNTVFPLHQVLF